MTRLQWREVDLWDFFILSPANPSIVVSRWNQIKSKHYLQRVFLARFLRHRKTCKCTNVEIDQTLWPFSREPAHYKSCNNLPCLTTVYFPDVLLTWWLISFFCGELQGLQLPFSSGHFPFLVLFLFFLFWSSSRSNAHISCGHEVQTMIYFNNPFLFSA